MSDFDSFVAALGPKMKDVLGKFIASLDTCETPLLVEWRAKGFELRVPAIGAKPAGRPRIFVFQESAEKVFAFFYKPSRLSFSKDRFSYGLLGLHRGSSQDILETMNEGLEYLQQDFRPALRPKKLPRTVNITIPRD